MLSVRACKIVIPAVALAGALWALPASATRTHRSATSGHSKTVKKKSASHQIHGQRQIEPERAREIQTALIREHYLSGEPSGQWDAESQAAMTKFQADQGWQTKITPDSRALIKLGLGPNHDGAQAEPSNQASLPYAIGAQKSTAGANSLLNP
ncbi:Peptidoglycan-binding domain 1 protein [Acidisarcina polymorpha]|uniref:Peptidoglycan-binding domain 1 protein n=1 Tax=Acidisarcina polymorpha TaxID=2211140 RepID=A0A2Z5G6L0_9BACT|nr:peptidoglycan-binding domain-containing protein [Acidisarcina polymorpha]AXC14427.1 Peptidoglycan-binding domain 1 protein [Acidisarcina polymorpha]